MALKSVSNIRTQKGAALLALLMIFIVAASYSLVRKLNTNTIDHIRRASSLEALNEAKAALIGYAIRFPEIDAETGTDPIDGPGYLPCPDINNDGLAGTSCALTPNGTTIGRIPWKTLELDELRDAAGHMLWYAVSDNYKNNPKVLTELNSDAQGNFSVDGNGDIVAILFAAGPPVDAQDRAADPLDVANYLEDDNANGDTSFVSTAAGEFNDTLVTITRQELMSAVEKRVLGDVDELLSNYHDDAQGYPWLSPFDPTATDFDAVVGTREGNIAFNEDNEEFATTFTVDWDIDEASATGTTGAYPFTPTATVPDWYDINNLLVDQESPVYGAADSINGSACTWTKRDEVSCIGRAIEAVANVDYDFTASLPFVGTVPFTINASSDRYYDFQLVIPEGGSVSAANYPRTRDVSYTAPFPAAMNLALTVTDKPQDGTYSTNVVFFTLNVNFLNGVLDSANYCWFFGCFNLAVGTGIVLNTDTSVENIVTGSDSDYVNIKGILYDIAYDDELPAWFVDNDWHTLTYVAYAPNETIPGGTDLCTTGGFTPCLTVSAINNVRALALMAGKTDPDDDAPFQNRPSTFRTDYFEDSNNTTGDNTFTKMRQSNMFNDQTRIILTEPP